MSTSWKAVCLKCDRVSTNPHPNYSPVRIEDLNQFIHQHHGSCGGSFQYMNEYQVGYEQVCDMGYVHNIEEEVKMSDATKKLLFSLNDVQLALDNLCEQLHEDVLLLPRYSNNYELNLVRYEDVINILRGNK